MAITAHTGQYLEDMGLQKIAGSDGRPDFSLCKDMRMMGLNLQCDGDDSLSFRFGASSSGLLSGPQPNEQPAPAAQPDFKMAQR